MKKITFKLVLLLVISCSTNNIAYNRILRNETVNHRKDKATLNEIRNNEILIQENRDFIISSTKSEIDKKQDLSVIETPSLQKVKTKVDDETVNTHIHDEIKSSQNKEQPTAPPNQREVHDKNQIEVDSSPPVTTLPPTEPPPLPIEKPKELVPEPLCPNAWYDENQTCDWIHPNLKPTDEIGRTVPIFSKSEDAWNWAEKQLFDETSIWHMCGFNLMNGHTNDGITFYYGYMKACP